MAGCQGWEHTEPCLEPGHAPSTGAERGWVKGYRGGRSRTIKKGRHADSFRDADCATPPYNPVFVSDRKLARHCEVKVGGKNSQQSSPI